MLKSTSAFGLIVVLSATVVSAATPNGFDQAIVPFLTQHCVRCHGEKEQEGKFRIDMLSRDFVDQLTAQKWAEVISRMNAGEMPPAEEPQPTVEELGNVVDWISARIKEGEAARMARRGRFAHYRLSRSEYAYTVYDLLGVHYDVDLPGALIEDPRWHGFDRIGSMLSLSPSHVSRYLKAADVILQRAFPETPPAPIKMRRDAISLQAKEQERGRLQSLGIADKVRMAFWPGYTGFRVHPQSGSELLRIRMQVSGLRPINGQPPHLSIFDYYLKRSVFDQDVDAAEDKPIVVEFLSTSSAFEILNDTPGPKDEGGNRSSVFISSKDTRFMEPTARKLTDDDGNAIYPLLLVDWIESEGPVVTDADRKKLEGLMPTTLGDISQARDGLKRFADRAWRRPATDKEIDQYVKLIERELAAGNSFRAAYMAAMTGILVSNNFLFLPEGSIGDRRDRVNDWELASRLSYFLWSSMPDDELLAAAQSGKLHEPPVLAAQLARMIKDPKLDRFTQLFPRQWLQLHKVGMFPPDGNLYPDYNKWLEKSMVLETVGFFTEVFVQNLPLREFLTSDWTVVNPRLAAHYQMPQPANSGFQRVTLRPEDHRGGLLTQASVLSLTSDGTRHRPVHRGVWVSEAIFGKTPPPPPPNVEPLAPTPANAAKATIRMQVEAHATHANCASCHRKIDPLGFAFDNFDAIGRWRTEESSGAVPDSKLPVNASGAMPDGRNYRGPEEFKQLLVQDIDRFAEAFIENLATFALRRAMTIDDAEQFKAIAQASKSDDYRIQTVIKQLVLSDLFQKR